MNLGPLENKAGVANYSAAMEEEEKKHYHRNKKN
jgi:hypothetical protein